MPPCLSVPHLFSLGMRARIRTLEDIAWRGLRLRVWCYGCARARELDGGELLQLFVSRDWALEIAAARDRFRCDLCGSKADVLAVPASAPPAPPPPEPEPEMSWAAEVARFFHATRKRHKEGVTSPEIAATLAMLNAPKPPAPQRTPPRRGHLRLVKPLQR